MNTLINNKILCKDIMSKNPITCYLNTSIKEVALKMTTYNIGYIPIVFDDKKTLAGVITDRDIVTRAISKNKDTSMPISLFITREFVTVFDTDDISIAISKMADYQLKRIIVTDNNYYLTGIISIKDIALNPLVSKYLNDLLKEISF